MSDSDSSLDEEELEYQRQLMAKKKGATPFAPTSTNVSKLPENEDDSEDEEEKAYRFKIQAKKTQKGFKLPQPVVPIVVPIVGKPSSSQPPQSDSDSELDDEELEYQRKLAARHAPQVQKLAIPELEATLSSQKNPSHSRSKRKSRRDMPSAAIGEPKWLHSGWLEKRGGSHGGLKTWKKRFFRIKGDRMQYFKGTKTDDPMLGELSLTGGVTRMAVGDEGAGREFCWAIQHLGGKDLLVAAETQDSMGGWLKTMRKVIQHQKRRLLDHSPQDSVLVVDGILWKRKQKNWSQRWFVYTRGKSEATLRWYEKKSDQEYIDEITIDDSTTVAPSDIQDIPPQLKHSGFVIRSNDQTLYLAASTQKDVKTWVQGIGGKSVKSTKSKMTEQERLDSQLQQKRAVTAGAGVDMRGFMTKQGGKHGGKKSWRRRYFILDGMYLKYYRDEVEGVGSGYDQMLGEVRVDDSTARPSTDTEAAGRQFVIAIQHKDESVFYVQAESKMEQNQWMEALRKTANFYKRLAFKFRSVAAGSLDILEGQLYKYSSRGLRTWTERWFKLKGDTLFMFKAYDSQREIGEFPVLTISSSVKSDVAKQPGCGLVVMHGQDKDGQPIPLRLSAPTPTDAQRWIEGIQQYIYAMKNTEEFTRRQQPASPISSPASPPAAVGGTGVIGESSKSYDLSGYLSKRGNKGLRPWHQRYFDVRGEELIYFRDQGAEPLGSIPLRSIQSIEEDGSIGKMQHCFTICTDEKNYSMAANSSDELQRWLTGLRKSTSKSPKPTSTTTSLPSHAGYLSTKSNFGWKRRYCRLSGSIHVFTDAGSNPEEIQEISLVDCTIERDDKKLTILYNNTDSESVTLMFDSVDDLASWHKLVEQTIKEMGLRTARTKKLMEKNITRLRLPRMNAMLSKKGGSGLTTHFKERFFSTETAVLGYYTSADDETPLGTIPWSCMVRIQLADEGFPKNKQGCGIIVHTSDRKDYLLAASTKPEAMSWVTALERWRRSYADAASESAKPQQQEPEGLSLPSMTGELLWLASSIWKKRLFRIQMDKLEYRISSETVALGYIPLRLVTRVTDASATAGQLPDELHDNAIVLVDQSKTYIFLAKTVSEAAEWRSTLQSGLNKVEEHKKISPMYGRKPDTEYQSAISRDDDRSVVDKIGVAEPSEFCGVNISDSSSEDISESELSSEESDSELDEEEREFFMAKIRREQEVEQGNSAAAEPENDSSDGDSESDEDLDEEELAFLSGIKK